MKEESGCNTRGDNDRRVRREEVGGKEKESTALET